MNPDLDQLKPYPFQRLNQLKAGLVPPEDYAPIALSIGEPKRPTPDFIQQALAQNLDRLAQYPLTKGMVELRQAIAAWIERRFQAPIDPEQQVLPVNGTREALFALAQAVIDRHRPRPTVLMPNPFYQIYEGAALLAGAQPYYLNCTEDSGLLPNFEAVPETVWQDCQLLYLCSPHNPTGAVIAEQTLVALMEKAERYDFIIAADECYSEIYFDQPPIGLLQAAVRAGNTDYRRCLVFHSLSKRSNAPGLRSGFVAGDAQLLQSFLKYRTYQGCAMPVHHQLASIAAWQDEEHVQANRQAYQANFAAVLAILRPVIEVQKPAAGFYIWLKTPIDDQSFARELYRQYAVTVLPGSYLSREAQGINPGQNWVRMALVAEQDECTEAAQRIAQFISQLK